MAQIRIEEKKSTPILPWILGLLLLALVVWGATELFEEADEEMAETEAVVAPVQERATEVVEADADYAYRPALASFMDYTADMKGEMGLDHEFSHAAITLLANATEALADSRDIELTENTTHAKQLADEITKDPYATDHADKIRMAAINITESLERIHDRSYESAFSTELDELRKEAQSINAGTLTLNQKEDVRSFFGAARAVLVKMDK